MLYSFRIVFSNHFFLSSLLQVVIALAQSWQPTFDPNLDGGKYLGKKGRQHLQTRLRNASTHPPVLEHRIKIPKNSQMPLLLKNSRMPLVQCNWDFATILACAIRAKTITVVQDWINVQNAPTPPPIGD